MNNPILSRTSRNALRQAEIQMLIDLEPNWFLTFNFGYRVAPDKARKLIAHWFNAAQRIMYGSDWAKQFDRLWPEAHCYLEHPETNPHFHALASIHQRMGYWAEIHGDALWQDFVHRGQLKVIEVYDAAKLARYCTKDYIRRGGYHEKFIYKDTRAGTIGQSTLKVGKES